MLLVFDGMRQAGEIFLNGKAVGLSENGITAYGVDLTDNVLFGGKENVLAVHLDNRTDYAERRHRYCVSSGMPTISIPIMAG